MGPTNNSFSGKEITVESTAPMPLEVNGEVTCHDIYAISLGVFLAVNVVVDYMSLTVRKHKSR